MNGNGWVETVRHFGRWFKTAAGQRDSLARLAERRGKAWLQGQAPPPSPFGNQVPDDRAKPIIDDDRVRPLRNQLDFAALASSLSVL